MLHRSVVVPTHALGKGKYCAVISAALIAVPAVSWATLGGDPTPYSDSDRPGLGKTIHREKAKSLYTVHTDVTLQGVEIHQYVGPDGRVFAITWKGPTNPDLRALFGPEAFDKATHRQATSPRTGLHATMQRFDDLIVQAHAFAHQHQGRAWIPALIPVGVSPEEVQ
ncbi:DUF2844 domain-containing protein [Ralstonia sp.]|uniref:DUF2844 domain-containing protein n=1 Tax=Ralstonia sp. TaxID=54061 RepID=UPI0031DAB74C